MRHAWKVVALTFVIAGLAPGLAAGQDKPIELRFSSWVGSTQGHHTEVLVPWAKMIEEKSGSS